jgi:magnesium-dependent phosphatase 1
MLFVFDLDFTLWDAGGTWCDHTMPPYRRQNGHVEDGDGRMISLYPEVRFILDHLDQKGITMALASRTHSPVIAMRLLDLFGIGNYFKYLQLYPGNKVRHFRYLHRDSGIPYEKMYFFDDEYRNIQAVEHLGVQTKLVKCGLCWEEIHEFEDLHQLL